FGFLTLHVSLGNFRNVDVEDLTKHKMDSEQVIISEELADKVNRKKEEGRRVCAVGTTVVRALESSITTYGMLKPFDGWTNKFIFPPYEVMVPNCMISNFHLPKSTLMMSVAAFAGYDKLMNAYEVAVKEKYQFATYGDAMLII
ncbi:MAG: S-adenosylmethionine:tRNA ribosyltransferase-isomerase, partial [Bacteroidales bacterium]|nr:S-adenosylmethionine:tRNA ribosyltransferase-isomerase [Bacteroidales bacterium]